jgi:two-component system LytT family response regulator
MPDRNGFQVLEQLPPERIPAVVFVTAFDKYAIDAFRVGALDYLLKPFDTERLQETLSRVRARLAQGGVSTDQWLQALERLAARARPLERVAVLDGDASVVIKTAEIRWLESEGNYVRLHLGRQSYLARSTLRFMEQRLDPARFIRIHRTVIVNVGHVRELRPIGHGDLELILADDTRLNLSRRYRSRLEQVVQRLV